MKLQLRFLVLLVLIFSGVAGLVFIGHRQNVSSTHDLLQTEAEQHQKHLDSIVKLDGAKLHTFATDYSFWDEMAAFVSTADPAFAIENIDAALSIFDADSAWVFSPDNKLVYATHSNHLKSQPQLNWPVQLSSKLESKDALHFYQQTATGLFEVRASTIVGSNDPKHASPTKGFLAVGRLIDDAYTAQISQLTQSTVQLNAAGSVGEKAAEIDTISVARLLPGYDGRSVAELRSGYKSRAVADLDRSYAQQLRLLLFLTLALVALSAFYIWREVLLPIRTISAAIKSQQPARLDPITRLGTEFAELAATIKQFFAQKLTISKTEFEKEELAKLHKEKVAFLAIAAHELSNPVNAVRLFSEYVSLLYKKGGPPDKINLMLDRISQQINKANLLISDLHGAAEGVGQNMTVNMVEIDFDKFLREEIEQAGFSIKHKLVLTGSTGQKVVTDPARLGQVVSNLLRNAYRYSPDADTIHITSKYENGQVMVGVQDFGLGISKEDQTHVFEQFYHATSVAELFPGLGLGLAISKQIVERLGGKIWLESAKGLGSTFYFSLPAAGDSKRPPSTPAV